MLLLFMLMKIKMFLGTFTQTKLIRHEFSLTLNHLWLTGRCARTDLGSCKSLCPDPSWAQKEIIHGLIQTARIE